MNGNVSLTDSDIGILVGYFVLSIAAGLFFSRIASRGIDHYFLGGRRIPGPLLTGASYAVINALTWFDGTLYGVDNQTTGGASGGRANLVSIDVATGAVTTLGVLPPNVDALEGNVR